jgi:hypothetical protein
VDPRQHVRAGDPIRLAAEQINGLNRLLQQGGGFGGPSDVQLPTPYTWVYAYGGGSGVNAWEGVRIAGLYNPSEVASASGRSQFLTVPVVLLGGLQDSTRAWGVAVEPIRPGGVGKVAISGVVQAKINVVNTAHEYVTGRGSLKTSTSGDALILWKESGTGEGKWALLRIGTMQPIMRVTFDSPWPKNTEQQVREVGSLQPYIAINWFASISSGGQRKGLIAYIDRWTLIAAEC